MHPRPSQPQSETHVCLGHVSGAKGLKGEVRVRTYTERPGDIAAYGPVSDETGQRTFTVTVVQETGEGVIARFSGVGDRTQAEKLRGLRLFVPRRALPDLPQGEYYQGDLIGLAARATDGRALGKVLAIHDHGAGHVLEVGETRATAEFWPAAALEKVDLAGGSVLLRPTEEIVADQPQSQRQTPAKAQKTRGKRT
ncbi:MAG: 16S rRNA processing protein RimM [Alphaproteobacteria bacterium]|nr:16S rRNA processing protein RimM [Alphaproteobacteria bacterium]